MLRRLLRRRAGEAIEVDRKRGSIEINEERVSRTLADGRVEAVSWNALTEVRVLTTSAGPFADDVFFVLEAGDAGCVVPHSQASDEFVARLQSLPGFDNQRMIEAMGTATEAEFVCWRRDDQLGGP